MATARLPTRDGDSTVDDPITREVTVAAPPDVVWDALTDPAELAAWFGADAEVDLRVGGAIRFRWPDGSERRGLVIDLDPPRRLAFRWRELRTGDRRSRHRRRHGGGVHAGRRRPRNAGHGHGVAGRARSRRAARHGGTRMMSRSTGPDAVFQALSDPTRREVMRRLSAGRTDHARRARLGPAGHAPGRLEAPAGPGGGGPGARVRRHPAPEVPPHPSAAHRCHGLDGRRRCGMGRPARRAPSTCRARDRSRGPGASGARGGRLTAMTEREGGSRRTKRRRAR